MIILGISSYFHDSSACLIKDGKIIAAIHEERFTRVKHDNSFPINAIKSCLEISDTDLCSVDFVVFLKNHSSNLKELLKLPLELHPSVGDSSLNQCRYGLNINSFRKD